jgi:hypothetical protein
MKFSCIPPKPKLEKTWHGLSKNQGVVRKHDEQYQMPTKTLVNYNLRQNKLYPPLQLSQNNI